MAETRTLNDHYAELLHVGIDADENGGERYSVRPHDLEDFRECVDRWGVDWIAD